MRLNSAVLLATAWLAYAGMGFASAWAIDNGTEVRVNPVAGGGGVLLYPGGQYMRVVPQLLEPGEKLKDTGPIRLHMPDRHARAREAQSEAQAQVAAVAPEPASPRKAAPQETAPPDAVPAVAAPKARKAVAAAAPKPAPALPGYNAGYGNFGAPPSAAAPQGAAGLSAALAPTPPPAAAPSPAPARVARANPPPASAMPSSPAEPPTPGLTKRSVILFAPQAADPAESAMGAIKFLAGDLNAAMNSPSARIQIQAYGGAHGDKGSDARRLSLKRALAIRQVLIDDGVAAERIDVRAMGGADDTGPADRVDVYIKT